MISVQFNWFLQCRHIVTLSYICKLLISTRWCCWCSLLHFLFLVEFECLVFCCCCSIFVLWLVPNVVCVSWLSILGCSFGFHDRLINGTIEISFECEEFLSSIVLWTVIKQKKNPRKVQCCFISNYVQPLWFSKICCTK